MALADVLRERVSRRGRTAKVACGLLGTVTVEALPPRECAADVYKRQTQDRVCPV